MASEATEDAGSVPANLLAGLPPSAPEELIDVLVAAGDVRIERIVSTGQASPPGFWYDQPRAEWVLLVAGSALLRFEDEPAPRRLGPGDHVAIAARRRHRVDWTDPSRPTVWLAVHYDDMPAGR